MLSRTIVTFQNDSQSSLLWHSNQGVQVVDDYRWLEPATDADVRQWSNQQNTRTRAYLDRLPTRAAIADRLNQLYSGSSNRFSSLISRGGALFAMKTQPPKAQAFLVTLSSPDDANSAKVIVDPNTLDPTGSTTIDFFVPSLDGKLVAVNNVLALATLKAGGASASTLPMGASLRESR